MLGSLNSKKNELDLHIVDGFDEWQHGCILKQSSNKIIDQNDISFEDVDEELVDDPYYFGKNRFLSKKKNQISQWEFVFVIL